MQNGILIKAIGGFYYVETTDGIIECKARGKFRKNEISPIAGDRVEFEKTDDTHGIVNRIYDRKNFFIRPPVANLDCIVFVVSVCEPAPSFLVLDKLIAISEYKGIEPLIVVTKSDIQADDEIIGLYSACGFKTFEISATDHRDLDDLKSCLAGKLSAFIGNSGVGKSTLLNSIDKRLLLETGDISKKLGRGRHTTRQVELFRLDNGGYIADTPGFSTVDCTRYDRIRKEELVDCFREFSHYKANCRFADCAHIQENGCAVLDAVKGGKIPASRHKSYLEMYEEAKQIKDWELKK